MGQDNMTLPMSTVGVHELDVLGCFRYANTVRHMPVPDVLSLRHTKPLCSVSCLNLLFLHDCVHVHCILHPVYIEPRSFSTVLPAIWSRQLI